MFVREGLFDLKESKENKEKKTVDKKTVFYCVSIAICLSFIIFMVVIMCKVSGAWSQVAEIMNRCSFNKLV